MDNIQHVLGINTKVDNIQHVLGINTKVDNIQHVLGINKPGTDVGQINPSITVREYTHKGFPIKTIYPFSLVYWLHIDKMYTRTHIHSHR